MPRPTSVGTTFLTVTLTMLLSTLFASCQAQDKVIIIKETPSDCIADESAEFHEFYDSTQLSCEPCSQNSSIQIASADGLSCLCQENYKIASSLGNPGRVLCEPCPNDKVASRDGWNCVTCNVTSSAPTDACPECAAIDTLTADRNLTGHWLKDDRKGDVMTCVTCENDTAPEDMQNRCVRCNQELSVQSSCLCPADKEAGGLCFGSSNDLLDSDQLDYSIVYDVNTMVKSAYLIQYMKSAQASCTNFTSSDATRLDYSNLTSCQNLANMCVLTLYSSQYTPPHDTNDPCSLYLRLVNTYGDSLFPPHRDGSRSMENRITSWKANMPWLYYQSDIDDPPDIVLTDTSIDQTFGRGSVLDLVAFTYSLNGTYLGLASLGDVPLMLCPLGDLELTSVFTYGTKFKKKCSVYVDSLFTSTKFSEYFYELYLRFVSGKTGEILLHAVPLLLTNYSTPDGILVNEGDDQTEWQLLRRYVLIDRIAGVEQGGDAPSVVRYLRDVTIHVRQQSTSSPGLIYPPYAEITYDYVTSNQRDQDQSIEVSFTMSYEVDLARTGRDMSIAIGVMSALALALAIMETSNWNKRQGKLSVDCLTVTRFVTFTAGSLANAFFVTVFGFSLWHFIVYKASSEVFVVPDDRIDLYVVAFISSAFVLKLVDVIQLLVSQCTVDVLLVDWERQPNGKRTSSKGGATGDEASAWRRLLVANEWLEIQCQRRVKPFWQLLFMILILNVVGVENLARVQPEPALQYSSNDPQPPYSAVFRFALSTSIYIGLAVIQLVFHQFWIACVSDPMMNLVDLCSLSNISLFIWPYERFGYYIHGRSAHGRADVSLREMTNYLAIEEEGLCGHRGLMPGSDEQTFEIFVPSKIRQTIRKLRFSAIRKQPSASTSTSPVVLEPDVLQALEVYPKINRFLQKYIDHNLNDADYIVAEKNLLHRILDYDPIDEFDVGYFFVDRGHHFDRVLFYGNEPLLVAFEVLLITVIDLLSADFVLDAVVAYVAIRIIALIRETAGKRNMIRSAKIDQRFLL